MSLREWLRRRLTNGARRDERDGLRGARFEDEDQGDDDDQDGDVDPFNPFPEPVRLEITDVIDLHAVPPREVKSVVEAYLEEARRAGFRSVRIIHGKGRFVQRETVRRVLARTPYVIDFTDAPPHAGGLGATVAHLSTKKKIY
ncbi:MAG: Smr/MutS family protein [Acidobacteriota bacterium]|nr:Smr/MutS family protein [Acidobacteriota bacterium]